jgi:hypothetical protein
VISDARDAPMLDLLARGIRPHGNLHLRFHQVELIEALLALGVAGAREAAFRIQLVEQVDTLDDAEGVATSTLHRALSEYLASLTDSGLDRDALRRRVDVTLSSLTVGTKPRPWQLECLETALGLAAKEFCRDPSDALEAHVRGALTSELWVVRWWGIANLVTMLEHTVDAAGAEALAELIVRQLTVSEEPVGLKHRQCALVRELLELPIGHPVRSLVRAQILRLIPRMLAPEGRERFERAYVRLGRDPGPYLVEFYGRVEALVSAARI